MNPQPPALTLEDVLADFLHRISQSQLATAIVIVILSAWLVYRLELLVKKLGKTFSKLFAAEDEEKKDDTVSVEELLLRSIVVPVSSEELYRKTKAKQINDEYLLSLERRIDELQEQLAKKVSHGSYPQSILPRPTESSNASDERSHGESIPDSYRPELSESEGNAGSRGTIKG